MSTPNDLTTERGRREWEAQERALREERREASTASDDVRVRQYRLIARALRQPRLHSLPDDFAALTAARVESATTESDERFEIWLQRTLILLLLLAGIACAAVFGRELLPAFAAPALVLEQTAPFATADWILVIAACLGLSLAVRRWCSYGANA
jgi:hypothetical protein